MQKNKSIKMAVSLAPAGWAQTFIKKVPTIQKDLVDAADHFQKNVSKKRWSEWSLMPMIGWYSIAAGLFDFKDNEGQMTAEEYKDLCMFVAAMAWSYEQRTYVINNKVEDSNSSNLSVLKMPSRALLNLTQGHKYGFYISLDNEIVEEGEFSNRPSPKGPIQKEGILKVDGMMVVMIDEMSPPTFETKAEFMLVLISGDAINTIFIKVGDWTIEEAIIQHLNLDLEMTETQAKEHIVSYASVLNVLMFFCTNQTEFLVPKDVASREKSIDPGVINPDVRFLKFDTVLGDGNRDWLAVETDGWVDVELAAIN
ncbi:hypothetical protein [Psychrobacter sp. UBA3480]|uniref:hypothetical protein n=1 Tax=Psychrobacter sp. UBA3480 TaxID=1947350 RepID=UPI0025DE453A|nr:hypothetical protein [Psychrobacter sp. UBA3480]